MQNNLYLSCDPYMHAGRILIDDGITDVLYDNGDVLVLSDNGDMLIDDGSILGDGCILYDEIVLHIKKILTEYFIYFL